MNGIVVKESWTEKGDERVPGDEDFHQMAKEMQPANSNWKQLIYSYKQRATNFYLANLLQQLINCTP